MQQVNRPTGSSGLVNRQTFELTCKTGGAPRIL